MAERKVPGLNPVFFFALVILPRKGLPQQHATTINYGQRTRAKLVCSAHNREKSRNLVSSALSGAVRGRTSPLHDLAPLAISPPVLGTGDGGTVGRRDGWPAK